MENGASHGPDGPVLAFIFCKGEANHSAASYPGFGASVKLTSFDSMDCAPSH